MVNQEIFGGLVSAMSRGESLHRAMFSLFNAGYKKSEIEDAARMLQSQTPVQIAQKQVLMKKMEQLNKSISPRKGVLLKNKKPVKEEKKPEVGKSVKSKQEVSKYGEEKGSGKFNKILDETIKNLQNLESPAEVIESDQNFKPPIIIQKVSDYGGKPEKKGVSKGAIIVLFILLGLLLASLAGLFIFKDKVIDFFNSLNF